MSEVRELSAAMEGPLGVIHETALILEAIGRTELAMNLAEAHESIQNWVIRMDESVEMTIGKTLMELSVEDGFVKARPAKRASES